MRAYFAKISLDSLLSNLLLYLLLAGYFVLAYGLAMFFGLLTGVAPRGMELFEDAPLGVTLLAIVIIAPTLFPFFRWARSSVNNIIYGQLDDPYALISEVNGYLQTMSSPPMTLPL